MEQVKWYKNPEMLVALTALFVGIVTTAISVYSAYIDRSYAKASVWPKVEISRSYSQTSFSYNVTNKGTGPAIIYYAKVNVKDRFIKVWHEIPEFKDIIQSHINNVTLPSGSDIQPLVFQGDSTDAILAIDNDLDIELCYCSIYNDCWKVSRSNNTESVEQCTVKPEHAFKQ